MHTDPFILKTEKSNWNMYSDSALSWSSFGSTYSLPKSHMFFGVWYYKLCTHWFGNFLSLVIQRYTERNFHFAAPRVTSSLTSSPLPAAAKTTPQIWPQCGFWYDMHSQLVGPRYHKSDIFFWNEKRKKKITSLELVALYYFMEDSDNVFSNFSNLYGMQKNPKIK